MTWKGGCGTLLGDASNSAGVELFLAHRHVDALHPKRRASTNTRPGSSIASAPAMVAARRSATRRGYLELDDAPPETDDRRMRPVVGVEFRQNALDSPFDGVFRNA